MLSNLRTLLGSPPHMQKKTMEDPPPSSSKKGKKTAILAVQVDLEQAFGQPTTTDLDLFVFGGNGAIQLAAPPRRLLRPQTTPSPTALTPSADPSLSFTRSKSPPSGSASSSSQALFVYSGDKTISSSAVANALPRPARRKSRTIVLQADTSVSPHSIPQQEEDERRQRLRETMDRIKSSDDRDTMESAFSAEKLREQQANKATALTVGSTNVLPKPPSRTPPKGTSTEAESELRVSRPRRVSELPASSRAVPKPSAQGSPTRRRRTSQQQPETEARPRSVPVNDLEDHPPASLSKPPKSRPRRRRGEDAEMKEDEPVFQVTRLIDGRKKNVDHSVSPASSPMKTRKVLLSDSPSSPAPSPFEAMKKRIAMANRNSPPVVTNRRQYASGEMTMEGPVAAYIQQQEEATSRDHLAGAQQSEEHAKSVLPQESLTSEDNHSRKDTVLTGASQDKNDRQHNRPQEEEHRNTSIPPYAEESIPVFSASLDGSSSPIHHASPSVVRKNTVVEPSRHSNNDLGPSPIKASTSTITESKVPSEAFLSSVAMSSPQKKSRKAKTGVVTASPPDSPISPRKPQLDEELKEKKPLSAAARRKPAVPRKLSEESVKTKSSTDEQTVVGKHRGRPRSNDILPLEPTWPEQVEPAIARPLPKGLDLKAKHRPEDSNTVQDDLPVVQTRSQESNMNQPERKLSPDKLRVSRQGVPPPSPPKTPPPSATGSTPLSTSLKGPADLASPIKAQPPPFFPSPPPGPPPVKESASPVRLSGSSFVGASPPPGPPPAKETSRPHGKETQSPSVRVSKTASDPVISPSVRGDESPSSERSRTPISQEGSPSIRTLKTPVAHTPSAQDDALLMKSQKIPSEPGVTSPPPVLPSQKTRQQRSEGVPIDSRSISTKEIREALESLPAVPSPATAASIPALRKSLSATQNEGTEKSSVEEDHRPKRAEAERHMAAKVRECIDRRKNLTEALELCDEWKRLNMRSSEAFFQAGRVHLMRGETSPSEHQLLTALKLEDEHDSTLRLLIVREMAKIKMMTSARDKCLEDLSKRNGASAVSHASRARDISPFSPQLCVLRAAALLVSGASPVTPTDETQEAMSSSSKEFLKELDDAFSMGADVLSQIGRPAAQYSRVMHRSGLTLEADALLEEICDRSNGKEVLQVCVELLKLFRSMESAKADANEAYTQGKYAESVRLFTRALELDPVNDVFNAILLSNRAASHMALGDNAKAVVDCDSALKLCPSFQRARLRRARALLKMNKHREAISDFEMALRANPSSMTIAAELAEARKAQQDSNQQRRGSFFARHSHSEPASGTPDEFGMPPRMSSSLPRPPQPPPGGYPRRASSMTQLRPSAEEDLYKVLGVSPQASGADIKKAYHRAALKHHPDKNVGDEEANQRFKKVSDAFHTLSDPQSRRRYDLMYNSISVPMI